ncbi:hypothetical protein GOC06_26370 [Sinorhizobium meliloti]|uniref:NB-ARC domain-containing protein n=1 Tax=Rhizobium meliloti TaxID=382 RepID=UPI00299E99A1|nr:hypothetical protein [Sinorhizobium meliloti]MDX0196931.1 hypothetical protein [Sinorhizobium meliloti]MDX0258370.1 hypothetical protein [Sinorhizobium meliloti]MDX0269879.1 hypothetical protein [Sinorhizobium meliloti]
MTLQSPEIAEAINSFVKLTAENEGRSVSFRFLSTSSVGREKLVADRPAGKGGLAYWEEAADGADVGPLRSVLMRTQGLSHKTLDFIRLRDDSELRQDLLARIRWNCGQGDIEAQHRRLKDQLVTFCSREPLSLLPVDGPELVSHVIAALLEVATKPGHRRLESQDLTDLLLARTSLILPRRQVREIVARELHHNALVPVPSEGAPPRFVQRPEILDPLLSFLLNDNTAPPGRAAGVTMFGLGGMGKTTTARSVAWDERVRQRFPDGCLWVSLGGDSIDALQILNEWSARLDQRRELRGTIAAARADFAALLQRRSLLIVIDDIWRGKSAEAAAALVMPSRHSRYLLTTRSPDLLDGLLFQSRSIAVDEMRWNEGRKLVELLLDRPLALTETRPAEQLFHAVNGHPMALVLAVSHLVEGRSWDWLLAAVATAIGRQVALSTPSDDMILEATKEERPARETSVRACLVLSVRQLTPIGQRRLALLGTLFPEATIVPSLAATLWSLSADEAAVALVSIYRLGLLSRTPRGYRMHGLVHNLAREMLTSGPGSGADNELVALDMSMSEAVSRLLQRYRVSAPDARWHLVPDDGYFHQFLFQHFEQLSDLSSIREVLSEETKDGRCAWFKARGGLANVSAFVSDVGKAADLAGRHRGVRGGDAVELEIHSILLIASVNDLSGAIPLDQVLSAVNAGLLAPSEAITMARQRPDPAARAAALSALSTCLDESLAAGLVEEALAAARKVSGPEDRASAISRIAAEQRPELALGIIRQIEGTHLLVRVYAFLDLLDRAPEDVREAIVREALAAVDLFPREEWKPGWMARLSAFLPAKAAMSILRKALRIARSIHDELSRADNLAYIAKSLPPRMRAKVLSDAFMSAAKIQDGYEEHRFHARTMARIANLMDGSAQEHAYRLAVEMANRAKEPSTRLVGIEWLAGELSVANALRLARTMPAGWDRAAVLLCAAEHAHEEGERVLAVTALRESIETSEGLDDSLIPRLVRYLRPKQVTSLIRRIRDPVTRGSALRAANSSVEDGGISKAACRVEASEIGAKNQESDLGNPWCGDASAKINDGTVVAGAIKLVSDYGEARMSFATEFEDTRSADQKIVSLVESAPVTALFLLLRAIRDAEHRLTAIQSVVERLSRSEILTLAATFENTQLKSQLLIELALLSEGREQMVQLKEIVALLEGASVVAEHPIRAITQGVPERERAILLRLAGDPLPPDPSDDLFDEKRPRDVSTETGPVADLVRQAETLSSEELTGIGKRIVKIIAGLPSRWDRASALVAVAQSTHPILRRETLAACLPYLVEGDADDDPLPHLLVVARSLPECDRGELCRMAFQLAEVSGDILRAHFLTEFGSLNSPYRTAFLEAAKQAAKALDYEFAGESALKRVIRELEPVSAVSLALTQLKGDARDHALAELAERLPLRVARRVVKQIDPESGWRIPALAKLSDRAPSRERGALLAQALEAAGHQLALAHEAFYKATNPDEQMFIAGRTHYLRSSTRAIAIQLCDLAEDVLPALERIEDPGGRAVAIAEYAAFAPAHEKPDVVAKARGEVARLSQTHSVALAEAVARLCVALPPTEALELLEQHEEYHGWKAAAFASISNRLALDGAAQLVVERIKEPEIRATSLSRVVANAVRTGELDVIAATWRTWVGTAIARSRADVARDLVTVLPLAVEFAGDSAWIGASWSLRLVERWWP